VQESALQDLVRWIDAGGEWRVVSRGASVTVSLVTCDGGEEMGRVTSADPSFVAFVEAGQQH
jgi:hypothetical protein